MYINSFCCISPAGIFTNNAITGLKPLNGGRTSCIEPDYSGLIPPMQLRRMSKPVRIGVAAAKICLKEAGIDQPGAIHVGTAYGMLQDTESFLQKMIDQHEQMLTPTAFIQSTHNTVAGQIALALSSNAHNMTYVHRAHSFESALLNAELLLCDKGTANTLVGAVEECTGSSYTILKSFPECNHAPTIGEGAAFFCISNHATEQTISKISGYHTFNVSDGEVEQYINGYIEESGMKILPSDWLYRGYREELTLSRFAQNHTVDFKHWCGSYPTNSSFALAMLHEAFSMNGAERCWVINQFGTYWSIILAEKYTP